MITFEDGLIKTWRLPLFSALYMLLRASFKTLTLTILASASCFGAPTIHGNGSFEYPWMIDGAGLLPHGSELLPRWTFQCKPSASILPYYENVGARLLFQQWGSLCICALGLYNIFYWNPHIYEALSPYYMYNFLKQTRLSGRTFLGGVLLCITGLEAMFPALRHFSYATTQIAVSERVEHRGKILLEDVGIDEAAELVPAALCFIGWLQPALLHYEYGFRAFLLKSSFVNILGNRFTKFIPRAVIWFLPIALLASAGMGINTCTLQIWAGEDLHNVEVQCLSNVANSLEVGDHRPSCWNKYEEVLIRSASKFWRHVSWPAPLSFDAVATASLRLCNFISGLAYDIKGWTDRNLEATWEIIVEAGPDPLSFNLEDKVCLMGG